MMQQLPCNLPQTKLTKVIIDTTNTCISPLSISNSINKHTSGRNSSFLLNYKTPHLINDSTSFLSSSSRFMKHSRLQTRQKWRANKSKFFCRLIRLCIPTIVYCYKLFKVLEVFRTKCTDERIAGVVESVVTDI